MPSIAVLPQNRMTAAIRPGCAAAAAVQSRAPSGAVVSIAEVTVADVVNATTTFAQTAPASIWTLAHHLDRFPSVTIVDTAGDLCAADVTYVDANTIAVSFGAPTAGTAYLN